jgi:hypothetical protein
MAMGAAGRDRSSKTKGARRRAASNQGCRAAQVANTRRAAEQQPEGPRRQEGGEQPNG